MLIHFQIDGGIAYFPGLSKPMTVDTASLPPAEAAKLEDLVRAAGFFTLPSRIGGTTGAADVRTYTISVEHAGQSHTVKAVEPVADPSLQSLIDALAALRRGPA
jgi:hypothetical protein